MPSCCLDDNEDDEVFFMSDLVEVVDERLSSNVEDLMGGKFPSVALERGKSNG